jgi:ATP-binding cassette subfamily F protein 3
MIRLLLEPVNLLILDEPTNHLDLASKDVLKKAIREFDGTAIIVSHDRDFLDGLVTKVYEFGGGRVKEHLGGIYDYLSAKKLDNLQQLELSKSPAATGYTESASKNRKESKNPVLPQIQPPENKLSYQEQKELNRQQRRLEKQIEEAEQKIATLEAEMATTEKELSTPDGASNTMLLQKYLEAKAKLDRIMNNWERLTLELESLSNTSIR